MHHISDVRRILFSFYNVLRPDGQICIIDLDQEDGQFHADETNFNGHNDFRHDKVKALLCDAGFVNINIHTFYHDKKDVLGNTIPYSLFCASGTKRE